MERLSYGHLPDAVDGGGVPDVEFRRGMTDVRSEPEPVRGGIRKRIARDGRGTVIHRFAIGVRTPELDAVAQPLLDIQLKGLVGGAGSPRHESDTTEVRIDPQIPGLSSRVGRIVRP